MDDKQIELIQDDDPYTKVYNALILDDRLRLQTRMVLIMMTSVPPDWDFSIRGMAKIAHVTKDTMSKMLAELEAAGYVKRKAQTRGSAGQFAKAGYLVSRKPIFGDTYDTVPKNQDAAEPCPNSSYTTEPYTKNSPQLNNKQLTTKQSSTPCSPPSSPQDCLPGRSASPNDGQQDGAASTEPDVGTQPAVASDSAMTASSGHAELNCAQPLNAAVAQSSADKPKAKSKGRKPRQGKSVPEHKPERFEQFWAYYPGGGSRLRAVTAWDNLAPDDALIDEMARALKRQKASRQWQDGVGIPHASTWLNQQRWTDKLPEAPQPRNTSGWAKDPEEATTI